MIVLAAYFVACGLLAVGVPLGLQRLALPEAARTIGRPVTAERVRFDPFRLRLVVQGLRIGGPGGQGDLLHVDAIEVDLSMRSLRHLAPVVEQLQITSPALTATRAADGRFDFADIVERLSAPPADAAAAARPSEGPSRFAVHDIALTGGTIRIDDRELRRTHEVTDLALTLPLVSTLPDAVATPIQPSLSAKVNGSPLSLTGESLPFDESKRTRLQVELKDFAFGPYLGLSPVPLGFTLPDGRLSTRLPVAFVREGDRDRLTIGGQVVVDDLAIDAVDGGRLVTTKRIAVDLGDLEPLRNRYPVAAVAIDGLAVSVVRDADGRLPIVRALAPRPDAAPAASTRSPATPAASTPAPRTPSSPTSASSPQKATAEELTWSIGKTSVRGSRATWTDRSVAPAVELDQRDIAIEVGAIGNRQAKPAPVTVALVHERDGKLGLTGEVDLAKSRAGGRVDLRLPAVAPYLPYLADRIDAKLATGPITVATGFEAGWADGLSLALNEGQAAVEAVRLALPGDEQADAAVRLGRLAVEGLAMDLGKQRVSVARALVADADLRVTREAGGQIDLARLAAAGGEPDRSATPSGGDAAASPAERPAPAWVVEVARVDLEDNRIDWLDRTAASPVAVPIRGLSGSIANVGTRLDATSSVDVRAGIGKDGQVTAKGDFVVAPLSANVELGWRGIALATFDPYLARTVAVGLQRGRSSGGGRVQYGDDRVRFAGKVGIDDLMVAERRNDAELLRWKSLAMAGIDAELAVGPSSTADRLSVDEITLDAFHARVELSAEGRLNLRELLKSPASGPGDDKRDGQRGAQEDAQPATQPDARPAAQPGTDSPMRIRLGEVRIENGSANFTDNFVKPNLSVDLSGLKGSVSAMASDASEPAEVDLAGRLDGDAPITISGKLNPFGPTLYADITASAKGIDLPTFTPYSGKYAGYAIEKGKLSLDARYRIENDKLDATNRILLDQLTFGDKVDSKDAIDLPLQFAIDLLKNRRGEIDLNLPIAGSLNDPQFSISGIIWNAVVNLFTRVVTSPFSALAAAFDGGEEISFIEFAPGTAEPKGDARKRLETIAKALAERPALKLEITGRMDPRAEADAFGRRRLEERLQALRTGRDDERASEGAKPSKDDPGRATGTKAAPPAADEREPLLRRLAETLGVSPDETPPPDGRNAGPGAAAGSPAPSATGREPAPATPSATTPATGAGTTSTQSTADLERRLAAKLASDPEAQRALAVRRSQAARDWLVGPGKIAGDRIFLLAPKVAVARAGKRPATPATAATGSDRDGQPEAAAREPQCTRDCAEFSLR